MVIQSGGKNLLFTADDDCLTLLHGATGYGLGDSVRQLIKSGGKKLILATEKYGWSALHYTSVYDHAETAR